jgi:succinyl-diaminopimelate desuccinylase
MNKQAETVLNRLDAMENEAVDLMKQLISINSIGPKNNGPGEQEEADFLTDYLKQIGFKDIKNYPAPDPSVEGGERPNIVAVLPGINTDKTLWIMSHMDVVPPGDLQKWSSDPFVPVVKDGRIYGRGSEDNQQGMVSSIIAARALLESGIEPAVNLGIVLVSDEETGSTYGLDFLLKNHMDLFKQDDLVIIPDAGEADGSMIEIAEKSIMWVRIETLGKQVHASTPQLGVNAHRAAANLIVELEQLHSLFGAKNELFDPPISTFEPTKKLSNVPNVNTIPGEDIFFLDCRVLPEYPLAEVKEKIQEMINRIEKKFKVKINTSTDQEEEAAPETSADAPVVQLLSKAVKEICKIDPKVQGIGGGTIAAYFRRCDIPAAVWSTLDDLAHQPDEYCKISNMMDDARVFVLCALDHK